MRIDKYLKFLKEEYTSDSQLHDLFKDASITSRAFDKLPEDYREIIERRYEDRDTFAVVALYVGRSESEVRKDTHRANNMFIRECRKIKLLDTHKHLQHLDDDDELIIDQNMWLEDKRKLHAISVFTLKELKRHLDNGGDIRDLRLSQMALREIQKKLTE